MRHRSFVVLAAVLLALAAAPRAWAVCSSTAQTWQCWEGSFLPAVLGTNPYRDLKVKVEFCPGATCTDPPNPANPSTYAFWDGGNQLKMRMAFPSPGVWHWKARCESGCSFTQTGMTPSIAAYSGPNSLYLNGGLTISTNGRFVKQTVPLASGGERPLVWVGDTSWSGPLRSSATQWTSYLTDRVNKSFTVLQTSLPVDWMQTIGQQPRYVIGGTTQHAFNTEPCGSATAEPHVNPMPRSQSCWNPAFWQAFEQKIFEANDKGLAVVIVGLMEGVIEKNAGGTWCPPDLAVSRSFARNVAARFAGSFVIFSPGFDRSAAPGKCSSAGDTTVRIKDIGGVIAAAAPRSLVTNHWAGAAPGNEILGLQDEAWLDVQLFQSGGNAANNLPRLSCRARQLALCVWNKSCPFSCPGVTEPAPVAPLTTKPGINGESIYDGDAVDPIHNALNVRRTGYFSMMSGAMGYTYGTEGIYNWGVSGSTAPTGWARRSSRHMQYLGNFFRGITFRSLTTDGGLILTPQPIDEHRKLVLARGAAGTYLVAYLPDNPEIKINLNSFPGLRVPGRWVNPRTNAVTTAAAIVTDPTKPGEITYRRPIPPLCGAADPPAGCPNEPASDPCNCVDSVGTDYGERDWLLVVP